MSVKHQDPFAEELRRWLESVLTDGKGELRMPYSQLSEESGVAATTLYRIRDGKGEATIQKSIDKIARVLGVPAPRIMRVLVSEAELAEPTDPLKMIASLESSLQRLRELVAATSSDEGREWRLLAADASDREALERVKSRTRRRKPKRQAGGQG